MKDLKQYHFDRDEMCDVFYDVFSLSQSEIIHTLCHGNLHYDHFSLMFYEDDYYILHRPSGVMINWYKHMGRINTCNTPDFTLDDLRKFLEELRTELIEWNVIK